MANNKNKKNKNTIEGVVTPQDRRKFLKINKTNFLKTVLYMVKTYDIFLFHIDIVNNINISEETYYKYWKELDPTKEVKEEVNYQLSYNKNKHTFNIRSKWANSDNFNAQLHLYRMTCTDKERELLKGDEVDKSVTNNNTFVLPTNPNIIEGSE